MDARVPVGNRVAYLDGLGGVAALAVLFHHFILGYEPRLNLSVLHGFVQGSFAVCIFFVLSGFVMAAASARTTEALPIRAIKRYLRLALPMLAAGAGAWILLEIFPGDSHAVGRITDSSWATKQYWRQAVPFWYAPLDSLVRPFVRGESYLDSSFWTMQPELLGSLAIFAIYAALRGVRRIAAAAVLAAAAVFTESGWTICFAAGIVFWEIQLHRKRTLRGIGVAAICLGGFITLASGPVLTRLPMSFDAWPIFVVASILVVGGVLMSDAAQRALSAAIPRFLGRISFGLYLVHEPLLMTAFAALWLAWRPEGLSLAAFLTLYASAALAAAWTITKAVDEPTLRLLKRLQLRGSPSEALIARTAP